jgi:predicted restriction endonuclease
MRKDDPTGVASWVDKHDKCNDGSFDFWTVYAPEAEDNARWTADDRALGEYADLEETVKQVLRNERRGQRVFRERVLQCESSCRLTGVSTPAHLRASHIKPWAQSNSHERLDGSNGLMLSPHVDHLFDRAYISFNDDGTLLVLNDDINQLLQRWGIDYREVLTTSKPFNARQCAYLAYHRQQFASLK